MRPTRGGLVRAIGIRMVAIAEPAHVRFARPAAPPSSSLLAELELARAEAAARAANVDLATWLVERIGVSRDAMAAALSAHFGCPFVELRQHGGVPDSLRAKTRAEFFEDICAV